MQYQSAWRDVEPFRIAMGRGDGGAASEEAPGHALPRVAAAQNQDVQAFTTSPVSPVRARPLESRADLV